MTVKSTITVTIPTDLLFKINDILIRKVNKSTFYILLISKQSLTFKINIYFIPKEFFVLTELLTFLLQKNRVQ